MKKIKLLAVLCAAIVGIGLFAFLQVVDRSGAKVEVVVAASDVPQNTILTEGVMEIKTIPEDMMIAGGNSSMETLVGKMAKVDIHAGEQIVADRITGIGDRDASKLAMLVEQGKRAVTIAVDEVTGLNHMIRPGDRVDVIAHVGQIGPGGEEEPTSLTVVENVPVLAVDNVMKSQGKSEGYSTVTLMVTPDQANELDWSENSGSLRITLRTPLDANPTPTNRVTDGNIGLDQ